MKNSYDTLVEAIEDLKTFGYIEDFNLKDSSMFCTSKQIELGITDFEIDKMYRFDGATDPGDESILYAISSDIHKLKGTMVNGYGAYSDSLTNKMVQKLKYVP